MSKTLAEELSATATEAQEKQKRDDAERLIAQQRKQAEEVYQARRYAENRMEELKPILREEARIGHRRYKVGKLGYNDYKNEGRGSVSILPLAQVTNLKYVYLAQALKKEGLNPEFLYQHDGVGMESWYDLMVSW